MAGCRSATPKPEGAYQDCGSILPSCPPEPTCRRATINAPSLIPVPDSGQPGRTGVRAGRRAAAAAQLADPRRCGDRGGVLALVMLPGPAKPSITEAVNDVLCPPSPRWATWLAGSNRVAVSRPVPPVEHPRDAGPAYRPTPRRRPRPLWVAGRRWSRPPGAGYAVDRPSPTVDPPAPALGSMGGRIETGRPWLPAAGWDRRDAGPVRRPSARRRPGDRGSRRRGQPKVAFHFPAAKCRTILP
jgi:hypothetical protein